jgi:N-acetylglutamate synthase-like GNAT family acetyltransferase
MLAIRPFQEQDWDVLLGLANQAVPFAPAENAEWFNKRREFDAAHRVRRHYLAWQDNRPAGYGGLEQQGDGMERLRAYVVAAPENITGAVGQGLMARLLADAHALGARTLWARELLADEVARAFFTSHGFVETRRATPPNFPTVVVFELNLPG